MGRTIPGYADGTIPGYEFEGPRARPGRGSSGARRLSYTPMANPPRLALQQAPPQWPGGEAMLPGFEFDGRVRPPSGSPRHAAPQPPTAMSEWAGLMRSFLPRPAERSWRKEFLANLELRGLALRLGIVIVAMIVLGAAVAVISGSKSSNTGSAPAATSLGFPPATLAGGQFTAAESGRGIADSLAGMASDGTQVVAVGSQTGARIARAQFFVSPNGGRSWAMGSVRTPGGGTPPPGHPARLVAGGRGAWAAVGPDGVWTSSDGRTWTLTSATGLPLLPGDRISVLTRTAAGFIAAGVNVPGRDLAKATPVLFTSADGQGWHRLGSAQLRLQVHGGRPLDIRYAAAEGRLTLIAGDVAIPGHAVAGAAWVSDDGGGTWTPVVTPGGHGAQPQVAGAAAAGGALVLIRPATAAGRAAADVYRSANGTAWTFQATLGLIPGAVNGGPAGAVITGRRGGALAAIVSRDGASWQPSAALGSAGSESVSGVAVAGPGAFVMAGTTASGPDSRLPVLTVADAGASPVRVGAAQIPGAFDPELAVNAVAAAGGTMVAAGSANGFPAAWTSADGGSSWTRAAGRALTGRPGLQQLTGVAHGSAGWLAVGGAVPAPGSPGQPAAGHPVVVGSADGRTWQAADREAAFAAAGLVTEQAAASGSGYVIVGHAGVRRSGAGMIAAAWWSAGLTGWRRAAVPADPGTQMLAVAATAGGFVAVGGHGSQPAAWTSPDGRDWSQANMPLPPGAARAVLQHVASSGRTVAAVGTALTATGQRMPFAARSADGGASWTERTLPVPSGLGSVTALAATGDGFTATGTVGSTPGHADVVVWTWAGGAAWRVATPAGQGLSGPGIQAITALTASAATLTGVGFTASPAGEQPVFWQFPIR
ncbi:MAG: hypothetical protein JO132_01765 [Streptosporangiaceae bacterium]|nr:hypothetical protein [Streptosporangiaceae bacterium]